jgi:hypothetical protein
MKAALVIRQVSLGLEEEEAVSGSRSPKSDSAAPSAWPHDEKPTLRAESGILPRTPYLGSVTPHFAGSLRFAKWKVVKK